jgi:hypothetical protein
MEIIDDRHDRGSIILASRIPVDRWHATIGDPTYADAILDRIVHNAIRLRLKGKSLGKPSPDYRQIARPLGWLGNLRRHPVPALVRLKK